MKDMTDNENKSCWEFMHCEKEIREHCPAYPARGLDCWKVTGTKCERGLLEMKSLEEKIHHCRACAFFKAYAHKI